MTSSVPNEVAAQAKLVTRQDEKMELAWVATLEQGDCSGIWVRIAVGGALERSALAGVGGKTPPLRVLFDGNVVMDVYATHRTLMHKTMI